MFQGIEVRKPIEHIYHTFDIEEKQSVTKINGGNNHRHPAKRSWGCRNNQLLAQQVQKTFSEVMKRS